MTCKVFPFKFLSETIGDAVCKSGQVQVLRWWANKTEKYASLQWVLVSQNAVLDATMRGHLDVVKWCFDNMQQEVRKIVLFPQLTTIAITAADAGKVNILDWAMRQAWKSPTTRTQARDIVNRCIKSACMRGHLPVLDYFAERASIHVAGSTVELNFPFSLSAAATEIAMQSKQTAVLDWFVARGLPIVFAPDVWARKVVADAELLGKWFLDNTLLPPGLPPLASRSGTVQRRVKSGAAILLEPANPSATIRIRISNPKFQVYGPSGFHSMQPNQRGTHQLAKDIGCPGPTSFKAATDFITPAELIASAHVRHMLWVAETQFWVVIEPHFKTMQKPEWDSYSAKAAWVDDKIKGNMDWEITGGPFVAPAKLLAGSAYTIDAPAGAERLLSSVADTDALVQFNAKVALPGLAFMPGFSHELRQELF
ncbi:hypothetical protein BCR44DRAFT_1494751 [Catenaria anguillulae PL171]|uniref:Uncharacterized protein n=1 Tax=Catenaria anguillulae PL171 TaxID=765915 RepID=A0A1Y2I3C2_9FUNG|nr:hypothetical protein BCR44DRAFT_1494751 [Catenaria anguillulae PL171]